MLPLLSSPRLTLLLGTLALALMWSSEAVPCLSPDGCKWGVGADCLNHPWWPLRLLHGLKQVLLKTSALGSSVEEVEQLIRKHETFQKVLAAQEEKVMDSGSQRWDGGSLGI